MRIVLASSSPRRRELLQMYGFPFEVIPSLADESIEGGACSSIVTELAARKGREVARRCGEAVVIASDTLVSVDGEILGKPKDPDDAFRMLKLLSGREHEVYSGLYLRTPTGEEHMGAEMAKVSFASMPEPWIRSYIASGEPMDKAGAYAIQGRTGIFVRKIEGNPFCIVGLPTDLLTEFLQKAGCLVGPAAQE